MAVYVQAFEHVAKRLRVPRVVVTPHLMGRTVGPVGDRERQRTVVLAALDLLGSATAPESVHHVAPDERA